MGHKAIVEVTIECRDGWHYPLYRALGTVAWNTVNLGDGSVASFKDVVRAEGLLEAVCDEFVRDGFYCQSVKSA
jgi:hypothetical protein